MAKQAPNTPAQDPSTLSRRKQVALTYRAAKESDRALPLWILGAFLVAGAIGFAIFWLLPGEGVINWVVSVVGALLFGVLGAMIVFGRRAQRALYKQMEGKEGAAAGALRMLKRGWQHDVGIAFNKQRDMVHRVVGPPGIVLVGEGQSARLKQLMIAERRTHQRVAADVPIHEVICGEGEGEVPLPKLVKHIQKLKRQVKPAEMTDLMSRVKALDSQRSRVPIPKGPVPTNMKGMRGNLRGR